MPIELNINPDALHRRVIFEKYDPTIGFFIKFPGNHQVIKDRDGHITINIKQLIANLDFNIYFSK